MGAFGQVLAQECVSASDDGSTWRGYMTDRFNVFVVPNGGLLMAVILRALRNEQARHGDKEPNVDCLSMNCSFISSAAANAPYEVRVEVVKRGRTVSWLRASLLQAEGKTRVTCNAAFGRYPESGFTENIGLRAVLDEAPGRCAMPPPSALSVYELRETPRAIFARYQWLMPEDDLNVFKRMTSQQATPEPCPTEYRTYARHEHPEEDALCVESLAALADSNVPTVKARRPLNDSSWVPSLTFDLHFYARPPADADWVLCHFQMVALGPDRLLEAAHMYDPKTGSLLCSGFQGALNKAVQRDAPKPKM